MKVLKNLMLTLFFLAISGLIFAENLDFIGTIKCSGGAEYSILEKVGQGTVGGNTLATLYRSITDRYLLVQTKEGVCRTKDLLTVDIKKPLEAFALIKFLTDIYNLQYIYEGDVTYHPTSLVFYRKGLTFEDLFNFVKEQILKQNEDLNLYIEYFPKNQLVVVAKKILQIQQNQGGTCQPPQVDNYIDLCNGKVCKRFYIVWTGGTVELHPYYECVNDKVVFITTNNVCQNGAPVGSIYIDKANLIQLLTLFEKVFNIHFWYNADELSQIKGANNIHISTSCLTPEEALNYLKRTFHIYIQKIGGNNYRLFADKDAYPLVVQKVSNKITKVFYLKGINAKDFIRLVNYYFPNQVIYSVDPVFNAVTLIGPEKVINQIAKKFGKYIKANQEFDDLMTKIFYVKFGDPTLLKEKIQDYLSDKGVIYYLDNARAFEITDYPTNIAVIEKVFGRFLSQKPIKIKVTVKFVTVDKSFTRALGINWSVTYGQPSPTKSIGSITAQVNPAGNIGLLTAQLSYEKFNTISLQLSALETISAAQTMDNPTLILLNGQTASITRGIQIPYQQSAENGGTTVQLVSANVNLNVQPELLPDGRIMLNLQLTKNSPGEVINGQTSINTFSVNDIVILANGDTMVIGGVVQKSKSRSETGVPIFREIPLLGWLFKNVSWQNSNKELLVFITAQVVN